MALAKAPGPTDGAIRSLRILFVARHEVFVSLSGLVRSRRVVPVLVAQHIAK